MSYTITITAEKFPITVESYAETHQESFCARRTRTYLIHPGYTAEIEIYDDEVVEIETLTDPADDPFHPLEDDHDDLIVGSTLQ